MKISLLSHDVSTNCLGRAQLLGRLLAPRHDVEIVGPASTGEVWAPLRGDDLVPVRIIPQGRLRTMAAAIDGDVLYAVKERPTSYGVAMAARRLRDRPLLVDCDDWEMGFLYDDVAAMVHSRFREETKWVARNVVDVRSTNNLYRTWLTEHRVRKADAVTVSSQWLAKRFGGEVIVHARDTDVLDPSRVDRDRVRAELGIAPDVTVVLFMGSPRRHKGLDAIVEAIEILGRPDVLFLLVGGDPGLAPHPQVRLMGVQPYAKAIEFLAAADVVALPQGDSPAARGQMPAKVYDAMAMGRALVVTDVSDLGRTVEGCGLVVPPGDRQALASAIGSLADDPALRERLGAAGRERCVREFSDRAMRPRLLEVVRRAVESREPYGPGASAPADRHQSVSS